MTIESKNYYLVEFSMYEDIIQMTMIHNGQFHGIVKEFMWFQSFYISLECETIYILIP